MSKESDNDSDASTGTTREARQDRMAAMKIQRKSLRSAVTIDSKKVNDLVRITEANVEQAVITIAKLKRSRDSLADIDRYLLLNGGYAEQGKEVERADEYQDTATAAIESLNFRLETYRKIEDIRIVHAHTPPSAAAAGNVSSLPGTPLTPTAAMNKPKLQELRLTTFDGEPMKFMAFWDDFISTVDSRNDYSQSDKFKYLREALRGRALEAVGGYILTEANYDQVKTELKERFGNPEIAIFAHFMALLDLQPATNDLKQLSKSRDECELHVRSLITLGLDETTFGRVFCPIILSKLPHAVRVELYRKNPEETWKLENLRKLLKDEVMARENSARLSADMSGGRNHNSNGAYRHKTPQGTGSSLMSHGAQRRDKAKAPVSQERRCKLCDGNHFEDGCTMYSTMAERTKRLTALKLCFVCLRSDHLKPDCRLLNKYVCRHCEKRGHNRCICLKNTKGGNYQGSVNVGITSRMVVDPIGATTSPSGLDPASAPFVPTDAHVANISRNPTLSKKGHAVMETSVALVQGGRSATKARFLFHTASTRSFIKAAVARTIGAKLMGQETTSIGRLGEEQRKTVSYNVCSVNVRLPNGNVRELRLSEIETISTPIRLYPINGTDAPMLSGILMAEGLVRQPCDIQLDILIGLDYYYEFVGPVVAHLKSGLVLKSTIIGHIVTGFQVEQCSYQSCALTMLTLDNDKSDCDLQRFWSIEELGIKDDPVKGDDDRALDFFNKTIKFDEGRYQVKWLFRDGMVPESDNRVLSKGRLCSLYRRLAQQPDILSKYDKIIHDQLQAGVIESAPEKPDGLAHYIPRHHVMKATSVTTKLRIVYDASAKARRDQHSLNECLYRGPVILANMGGMLMRLRLPRIAMTADIEKAFLQIGLQREDRDATRFFWLKDCSKPPTQDNINVLRFARVPFGFATSSFLLDGTIAHHLRLRGGSLALQVLSDLFVDNVLGGRETLEEAATFYAEVKGMFADAALNLREWYSNSKEFVAGLPEADRGRGHITRFLGLSWDTDQDTLAVTVGNGASTTATTKRGVLRGIASTFDPCGWFSPVVCVGKILMQDIWRRTLDWDAKLPDEFIQRWHSVQSDILRLESQSIPRLVVQSVDRHQTQFSLHCFCDASSQAYGAVVYLVSKDQGNATSGLLLAKSRVCPIKEISMPRLELIAVTMGTKLVRYIRAELRLSVSKISVWTDSKCVLWWIAKDSVKERFVENRLEQIRSPDIEFRYVPTNENPADMASRGVSLDKLIASKLWWCGPSWLVEDKRAWPLNVAEPTLNVDTAATTNVDMPPRASVGFPEIQRFSTLSKLVRTVAYVLRFVKRLKREVPLTDHLKVRELREATELLERLTQDSTFGNMPRNSERMNLFSQLGVYKDGGGILRCRGRLELADIPMQAKNPILLPKSHHFTRLVIEDAHRRVLHSGVKHTLAETRQRYWIVHGRREVRKILLKCRRCRRYQGEPFQVPEPPPLPNFRVSVQRPFSHVGLDYAGPVIIRDGETTSKAWICLFTCAAIRAIHLELVTSLTTEDFLLALRRFSALNGVPDLIVCDNGSQFRSAEKVLRTLAASESVQGYSANAQITWEFIPEMAPWMGGLYERLISPVKRALRRCVGHKLVNAVELQTVLYEIAAVLNSRPLFSYESEEIGQEALTPNHFLLRSQWQPTGDIDRELTRTGPRWLESLILSWKRIQNVLNAFWTQWQRDYLLNLREHFWPKPTPHVAPVAPREGQVVLVSERNTPRGTWRLARITKLIPSRGGQVRTVEIKFANSKITRRPIKLLHPLESCEQPLLKPVVPGSQRRIDPQPPDSDEEYDEELLVSCLQGH